jgi:hypothetical protein
VRPVPRRAEEMPRGETDLGVIAVRQIEEAHVEQDRHVMRGETLQRSCCISNAAGHAEMGDSAPGQRHQFASSVCVAAGTLADIDPSSALGSEYGGAGNLPTLTGTRPMASP